MGESDRSAVEQDPSIRFTVDTETVAATRYEPVDIDGQLPAVLWYTPYHKDDETTHGRYHPLLEYIAAHGYEVVVADMLGTGASTGHRAEFFGPDLGPEVAAVIEAIADRSWTTDTVGIIGKSFPGAVCLAAAAANPTPLEASVPILTTHRRERMAFAPGDLEHLWMKLAIGALYVASGLQPPSRREAGWEAIWEARLDRLRETTPPLARILDPDPADTYWDWTVPVEDIDVPTFAVGGYRDHFPQDTVEYFTAIDAPKRLLMGPWRHVIPYQGREAAIGFREQVVDWFDRFLKGESGGHSAPEIAFWTERDGGRQADAGCWRGDTVWPTVHDSNTDLLSFAVTPEGLARAAAFETGAVERRCAVDHTVGLEAHDIAVPFVDTNADDARAMTFETSPVDRPVELTGSGEAVLQMAVDGSLPVCVRLVDVAPDGRARPLTRGGARLDATADPLRIPLAPVSHVLEAGHSLRMAVSAADFPSYMPSGSTDEFVVTSTPDTPTTVRLPGSEQVPESFADTLSMPPPDTSLPLVPPAVENHEASWETTREHERGSATRHRDVTTEFALPHVRKHYDLDVEVTVAADDPETLSASGRIETTFEYPDDPITLEAIVRRELDGAKVAATVRRADEVVFDRDWSF